MLFSAVSEKPIQPRYERTVLAVTREEVRLFAEAHRLTPQILARCSTLFCLELLSYHHVGGINPRNITEEILAMEGMDRRPRGTPRPEKFRHEALRGLRKKHWFAASFIPENVLNAVKNGGFDHVIMDVLDPAKAPPGETREEYAERVSSILARLSVEVPIQQRQQARKLTGEWNVFAPHPDGNHYQSVSAHGEGDAVIRDKIIWHSVPEFPFLGDVLRVGATDQQCGPAT